MEAGGRWGARVSCNKIHFTHSSILLVRRNCVVMRSNNYTVVCCDLFSNFRGHVLNKYQFSLVSIPCRRSRWRRGGAGARAYLATFRMSIPGSLQGAPAARAVLPTPCTLNPTLHTLLPTPCTLHPTRVSIPCRRSRWRRGGVGARACLVKNVIHTSFNITSQTQL